MAPSLLSDVHRRYNPLRKSWVLCSPHRIQRPWQGAEETVSEKKTPEYDPKCYLCSGNTRAGGAKNPEYTSTYIFTNDYAAVTKSNSPNHDEKQNDSKGLFVAERVNGTCLVVCFSPDHSLTIAEMSISEIVQVIDAWQDVYQHALDDPMISYCQIFENKGSAMGCSNPHPHGQCWLTSIVPDEPQIEHDAMVEYFHKHRSHLLEDYVAQELLNRERIVDENETFVVLVPFWATWPFETLIVSKRRIDSVCCLNSSKKLQLAEMIKSLTVRYDNLFCTSFPYSMGIHQAFTQYNENETDRVEHLMLHFFPPLLRSASIRKFLVGFELLGMPQRDITPESAAKMLQQQSLRHYLQ